MWLWCICERLLFVVGFGMFGYCLFVFGCFGCVNSCFLFRLFLYVF